MKYEKISSKHVRRVLFCKVDLDTCLAALILNVAPFDARSEHVIGKAPTDALADINTLCIECGGAGQVYRGNFDHHDTPLALAPACHQAYAYVGESDAVLERLVNYVGAVDVGPYPHVALPSLNALFSGMLFLESDPQTRLGRGIELLQMVRDLKLDPFAALPLYNAWAPYLTAKLENSRKLALDTQNAGFHMADSGIRVGFLTSTNIGGAGFLYTQGCQVALLHNAAYGTPPVVKYTIGGKKQRVNHLLDRFNALEFGWGGMPEIIGSPFGGSRLEPKDVLEVVLRYV